MVFTLLLFFAGLLLLYYGAESLVTGSSRLAFSFGIRPLVVGMTVVAFATSAPELLVSLFAAIQGSADIATGNIIGSNIANIGLILGAAAILHPLAVSRRTLLREIPLMILSGLLLYLMALDGLLDFANGLVLILLLLAFLFYCLRIGKHEEPNQFDEETRAASKIRRGADLMLILVGIVGLGVGAELMVRAAVTMARYFGLSELVIGMTIVALGTSLPELAASMMSAWKGEMDISVGNVIGSNIFNVLFVLGLCPMLKPLSVEPTVLKFEMPYMLVFSMLLIPLIWHKNGLGRRRGVVLLAGYLLFIGLMFIREPV
ncbi:MAG TPA: calcium/sodium antiporter [Geothermobacteraceae bacterium]|nr:calcium/sodium antiporter [Geothermobacteraceae bacterium]